MYFWRRNHWCNPPPHTHTHTDTPNGTQQLACFREYSVCRGIYGKQYSAFKANGTRIHKTSRGCTFLDFFLDCIIGFFPRSLRSLGIQTMDDYVSCN